MEPGANCSRFISQDCSVASVSKLGKAAAFGASKISAERVATYIDYHPFLMKFRPFSDTVYW